MPKQRKYTKAIGTFKWATNVTEYDVEGLPNPEKGIKALDPGFETIWNYEFLMPLVEKARKKFFKKVTNKLPQNDLIKINDGIRDYVKSSTKTSKSLDILKASILRAHDEDLLTRNYDFADSEVKQIIKPNYFENVGPLLSIDKSLLINPDSILKYQKLAIKYTKKVLYRFIKADHTIFNDIDDMIVYRGQGNVKYYKNDISKNFADTISIYTGIGMEGFPYFERQIINSFSINSRVAEAFMVRDKNNRRAFIKARFIDVMDNLFSSFIVSDLFEEGQYELLLIPGKEQLFIQEVINDERSAEFRVSAQIDLKVRY
ncbi:hypothetical protein [Fulvivirga lutea]|uniref:Uncharacterized protein n=1 Tax=Fulvivirga lutea TaxID=2810512 RepID=A0A974WEQ5_9BACT|nr:hypothetical protein [Fulvivirga lutea]QSE96510.1 hypothetical protein JR347_12985 [Fulvivirga lutea]